MVASSCAGVVSTLYGLCFKSAWVFHSHACRPTNLWNMFQQSSEIFAAMKGTEYKHAVAGHEGTKTEGKLEGKKEQRWGCKGKEDSGTSSQGENIVPRVRLRSGPRLAKHTSCLSSAASDYVFLR